MRNMIMQLDNEEFRQIARMSKMSFFRLLERFEDPIFRNNSPFQQTEVWIQLLLVLHRFGCYGNGASRGSLARTFGVSAGSVNIFTDRVMQVILDLEPEFLYWPNAAERHQISSHFGQKFGLPGCVGIVDGTPFNLSQRPAIEGSSFFNRKSNYAFNIQLVCDDRKLIRAYVVGWPGPTYDSVVWEQSQVHLHPERFFSEGQYIIADAGYTLSQYCCVPYKAPESELPANEFFNHMYSKARVAIEHTNGLLKGRWMSLKCLPTQIKKREDIEYLGTHMSYFA